MRNDFDHPVNSFICFRRETNLMHNRFAEMAKMTVVWFASIPENYK